MVKWAKYFMSQSRSKMMYRRRMQHYASVKEKSCKSGKMKSTNALLLYSQFKQTEEIVKNYGIPQMLVENKDFNQKLDENKDDNSIISLDIANMNGIKRNTSFLESYTHRVVKRRRKSTSACTTGSSNDDIAAEMENRARISLSPLDITERVQSKDLGANYSNNIETEKIDSSLPYANNSRQDAPRLTTAFTEITQPMPFPFFAREICSRLYPNEFPQTVLQNGMWSYCSSLPRGESEIGEDSVNISDCSDQSINTDVGDSNLKDLCESIIGNGCDAEKYTLENVVDSFISLADVESEKEAHRDYTSENLLNKCSQYKNSDTCPTREELIRVFSSGAFKTFMAQVRKALENREYSIEQLKKHLQGMVDSVRKIKLDDLARRTAKLVENCDEEKRRILNHHNKVEGILEMCKEYITGKVYTLQNTLDRLEMVVKGLKGLASAFREKELGSDGEIKACVNNVQRQIAVALTTIHSGRVRIMTKFSEFNNEICNKKLEFENLLGEMQAANLELQQKYNTKLNECNTEKCRCASLKETNTEIAESLAIKTGYIVELERQMDEMLKMNKFYEGQLLESDKVIKELRDSRGKGMCDVTAEISRIKKAYFKENTLLKLRIEELELECNNKE
ncbi:hypothetical protein PAEPH01_0740 [Pancytospora epiphaga]|nr:hypothetical protein PAEPH01_0740 [Pancytospora epiphaga]